MARVPFFGPRYNIALTPAGSDSDRQERALTRTDNDVPWTRNIPDLAYVSTRTDGFKQSD
jgi:hypothetical protein